MKIKKSDLKKIIIEEMKKATDLAIAHDDTSDVKAQEDSWAGGQNVHWDKDHTSDLIEAFSAIKLKNFVLSELKK
ncbi:hypothetical protein OAA09_01330 [bacterium]|nr:hypothetical protein [bacterium]